MVSENNNTSIATLAGNKRGVVDNASNGKEKVPKTLCQPQCPPPHHSSNNKLSETSKPPKSFSNPTEESRFTTKRDTGYSSDDILSNIELLKLTCEKLSKMKQTSGGFAATGGSTTNSHSGASSESTTDYSDSSTFKEDETMTFNDDDEDEESNGNNNIPDAS